MRDEEWCGFGYVDVSELEDAGGADEDMKTSRCLQVSTVIHGYR